MPRTRKSTAAAVKEEPAQPLEAASSPAPQLSPADLIKAHQELKAWCESQQKAFGEMMKPYQEKMEGYASQLLELALAQKVNSFSTDFGTAYISTGFRHKVDPNAGATWTNPETGEVSTGREALLDWLLANWDQYGSEHAAVNIGIDGVKAYMEATKSPEHPEGQLPPGISIERWSRMNIRKS